jgi:hypothetical protein
MYLLLLCGGIAGEGPRRAAVCSREPGPCRYQVPGDRKGFGKFCKTRLERQSFSMNVPLLLLF